MQLRQRLDGRGQRPDVCVDGQWVSVTGVGAGRARADIFEAADKRLMGNSLTPPTVAAHAVVVCLYRYIIMLLSPPLHSLVLASVVFCQRNAKRYRVRVVGLELRQSYNEGAKTHHIMYTY